MAPEDAVALLGLYLRLRGEFVYERGAGHTLSLGRWLFFWSLTRALLPAGWRWFSACVATSDATGDEATLALGQSALIRLDRALRARDKLHEQFLVPQSNDTMDEGHFYLDVVLTQLFGAFDAVARVAHLAYGLKGSYEYAGWRRSWRQELAKKSAALAALMDEKRAARDCLEMIAALRNTIHGEALQGVHVRGHLPRRLESEYTFRVPTADQQRLMSAARRRGGLARWGMRHIATGHVVVASDRFVEALIPDAARALNRLMAQTGVTKLPGVVAASLTTRAPETRDDPFNRWMRRRLRLLAGL